MTDEQIVQFLLYRAKKNGCSLKLSNPKLVIYKSNMPALYLAIRFDGHNEPFILRFTNGTVRALFKIKVDNIEFISWRNKLIKQHSNSFEIEYDLNDVPSCVKHFVSYAIIESLKTKGMGFDLFAISFNNDVELINPNESYEEVAIETDLLDFDYDMPVELTTLPQL